MIRPKKSLGQHFLFDPRILARIANALPECDGPVLEVGPGPGGLTRALLDAGRTVIAVEKDAALAEGLKEKAGGTSSRALRVIVGDALEVDWHRELGETRFQVCGNIPYNLTSPLIEKALKPPRPDHVVFLVQAEVADRLSAGPGSKDYGALTVGVQVVAAVERLFTVRAGSFRPRPRVESAVVRLTPLARPLISPGEEAEFRRFVKRLFGGRRKQIGGILRRMGIDDPGSLLLDSNIQPQSRPEEVAPAGLVRLFWDVRKRGYG